MSKHASKSRLDKGGKTPSIVTLTPVSADIVPGKLTDTDWHALMDRDDSDEFIADIVEEIYKAADRCIFDLYISRQVVPFTVWQAKDALVQIIEWIYLARDAGPSCDNTNWCQDDEPRSSVIDCWAQGSVPRQAAPTVMMLLPVIEAEPTPEVPCDISGEKSDNDLTKNPDEGSCPVPEVVCEKICPEPEVVCEEICPEPEVVCEESCPVPEVVCEPKQSESNAVDDQLMASNLTDVVPAFNLAPVVLHPVAVADEQCGDKPVAGQRFCLPDFVPVQHSCVDQILADNVCVEQKQETLCPPSIEPREDKVPHNFDAQTKFERRISVQLVDRPASFSRPTMVDLPIDHQCNPIPMKKIPAQKLPSNRIETTFMILDPQTVNTNIRYSYGRVEKSKPGRMNTNQCNNTKGQEDFSRTSFMPHSLFETMEVAPGVTVRELDRVKKGPKLHTVRGDTATKASEKTLQPVRRMQCNNDINVCDLLDRSLPVIKPLYAPTPVPPISQRSSVS